MLLQWHRRAGFRSCAAQRKKCAEAPPEESIASRHPTSPLDESGITLCFIQRILQANSLIPPNSKGDCHHPGLVCEMTLIPLNFSYLDLTLPFGEAGGRGQRHGCDRIVTGPAMLLQDALSARFRLDAGLEAEAPSNPRTTWKIQMPTPDFQGCSRCCLRKQKHWKSRICRNRAFLKRCFGG